MANCLIAENAAEYGVGIQHYEERYQITQLHVAKEGVNIQREAEGKRTGLLLAHRA
jgi:hypothetical protein